jgi:hypothetical protein
MNRLLKITIGVAGAVLGVFIVNILLFSFVPAYHNALEGAVTKDKNIPIVTVDGRNGETIIQNNDSDYRKATAVDIEETEADMVPLSSETPKDSSSFDEDENFDAKIEGDGPQIIDKEYHEDCGTGKGYWVIKYADGSTSVEQ